MTHASILDGGKPHPQSYRPDLPFTPQTVSVQGRGVHATASLIAWADSMVRKQERAALRYQAPDKSVYSANKAHPASYRPDLPLRGFTDAALVTLTKADREYYAARPLTMSAYRHACPFMERCEKCAAHRMSDKALDKARAALHALNIHTEG